MEKHIGAESGGGGGEEERKRKGMPKSEIKNKIKKTWRRGGTNTLISKIQTQIRIPKPKSKFSNPNN